MPHVSTALVSLKSLCVAMALRGKRIRCDPPDFTPLNPERASQKLHKRATTHGDSNLSPLWP